MSLLALWQLGSIGLFFGILEWHWHRTGRQPKWYHLEPAVPVLFSLPLYIIATAGELLLPKLTG